MAVDLTGIVDWLKGWFYDKNEVNTYLNAKANKNLTNANMNVVTDASGDITTEAKPTPYTHPQSHPSTMITESSALSYIETSANASQHTINDAIDTMIGNLQSDISDLQDIEFIKVVSDKGTASLETMNKLYIVSENNKVNVYYTKRSGTAPNYTYAWQKMDENILDELSLSWSDITEKPFDSVDSALDSSSTNPVQNKVINTALLGKAPTDHSALGVGYGVGTSTKFGHVKVADNVATTTFNSSQPVVLSARQGYILAYGKHNKGECVTSIALVPKSTDNTGAIKLYYDDEPV